MKHKGVELMLEESFHVNTKSRCIWQWDSLHSYPIYQFKKRTCPCGV